LASLLRERKVEVDVERAVFLTVWHRLFESASDRQGVRGNEDQCIDGVEGLQLHQFYRAMAWLGQELPNSEQVGATPFSPRCVNVKRDVAVFARNMDLLTTLDLVFFDTSWIWFEGVGGDALGQYGQSNDEVADLKQMAVGMVLDNVGRRVCSEMWRVNRSDGKSLVPIVERLRTRCNMGRVCMVADRAMIGNDWIE